MTRTGTLKSRDAHQLDRFAATASREAGKLLRLVLYFGIISLGSACFVWIRSFSTYLTDSLQSFGVCLGILLAVMVPGAVLLVLYVMLRQLSSIVERFPETGAGELAPETDGGEGTEAPPLARWGRYLRSRLDSAMALWSALDFSKDELVEAGLKRSTIALLAHPVSMFAMACAVFLSVLLILSASLSALWIVVSSIF